MLWINQMLDARAHKQKYIWMYNLKYFFLNLQKSRGKYQFNYFKTNQMLHGIQKCKFVN